MINNCLANQFGFPQIIFIFELASSRWPLRTTSPRILPACSCSPYQDMPWSDHWARSWGSSSLIGFRLATSWIQRHCKATRTNGRNPWCLNMIIWDMEASTSLYSIRQITLTIWKSITVQLTSCLTGLDLTKQVKLLFIQHKQGSWIQTK